MTKIKTEIINGVEYFTYENIPDVTKMIKEMQEKKRKQNARYSHIADLCFWVWTTVIPVISTFMQLTGEFKNEIFLWFFGFYFLWRYFEFEHDKN